MRLLALLIAAPLLAHGPARIHGQETPAPQAPPAAPAPVADPAAFFLKSCAGCHGQDGSSTRPDGKKGKAQDLTDAWWQKHTRNDEIVDAVLNGRRHMPPFKGRISEADALKLAVEVVRKLQAGTPVKAAAPEAPAAK